MSIQLLLGPVRSPSAIVAMLAVAIDPLDLQTIHLTDCDVVVIAEQVLIPRAKIYEELGAQVGLGLCGRYGQHAERYSCQTQLSSLPARQELRVLGALFYS